MEINAQEDLNWFNSLPDKSPPPYRKAYSDRTAWLMAYLSQLAYIPFNNYDGERENLKKELGNIGMGIIETFDCDGTQAILVSNNNFIALAFRGTEATSIKDIKADVNAKNTQCETGGKIHSGFKKAFEKVEKNIQQKLNEDTLKDKPLFIAGHSLGGALATIAAKKLNHKGGIAACYTFGSPRVGDEEWIADIKTPIYRMVNAVDCVTMLPPGNGAITAIAWLFQFIAQFKISFISKLSGRFSGWLLSNFGGYIHCGNMRYLTPCRKNQYDNVKLLYSVSWLRRITGWFVKKSPWKKFLSDHSISIYRKKLMVIAKKRN